MTRRLIDGINKRIDDLRTDLRRDLSSLRTEMNTRCAEVNRRLDRIELDERTSPIGRGG